MLDSSLIAKIVYTEQTYMDKCMFVYSKFARFAQDLHKVCTSITPPFSPEKRRGDVLTLCKFGVKSVQTV